MGTSYPDQCLDSSEFLWILQPLVVEATNIIKTFEVDPNLVKLINDHLSGYIRIILAQHQQFVILYIVICK